MHKTRFSIENKILLPFAVITLLSVAAFCWIFFLTEYQLKITEKKETAKTLTSLINSEINRTADSGSAVELLDRSEAMASSENIFIYDPKGNLILSNRTPGNDELLLMDSSNNRADFRIMISIDRKELFFSLLDEQRYMLLAAICMLLVIVQTSTFVAYNISDPLRGLAEICTGVSSDPGSADPDFSRWLRRTDEIGQLAAAFRSMMKSLRNYTDQLSWMKALNEGIVETVPLGLSVRDISGNPIFRNSRAAALLTGDSSADADGKTLPEIIAALEARDDVLPTQISLKSADGRNRNYEIGVWKLPEPGSGKILGSLCTIDDVTYRTRMEEKLAREETLAYTGRLAADVAHEAKNPLAGIRAGLQVLDRKLPGDREKLLCGEMIKEVDRVTLLINNLVNLARQRESEKTLVDLNALCDDILLLYSKAAENKNVRLSAELSGSLRLFADEQEIRQILINLINNSIKAMPDGGTLVLSGQKNGGGITVTVTDTGTGFTEKRLKDVLDGTSGGLGISIVRRLVKRNGGTFAIDSREGAGTRVTLQLRGAGAQKNPKSEREDGHEV